MRVPTRRSRLVTLMAALLAVLPIVLVSAAPDAAAGGPNLVDNPGFETVAVPPYTTFTGNGSGGLSAAFRWSVFNNGPATTATDLLPFSSAPSGGAHMLHVATNGLAAGIVGSVAAPAGAATTCSVWVFVVVGQASIGCGATGLPGAVTAVSNPALNGTWQHLSVASSSTPVSEMVVYSRTLPFTDFYVDNAVVTASALALALVPVPPTKTGTGYTTYAYHYLGARVSWVPGTPPYPRFVTVGFPVASLPGSRVRSLTYEAMLPAPVTRLSDRVPQPE